MTEIEEMFCDVVGSFPIIDSGERRVFPTGAVRDMAKKGRCDLLPWDTVGYLISDDTKNPQRAFCEFMENAVHGLDVHANLELMLFEFIEIAYEGNKFSAFLDVAYHYEDGCKKYGDRNWELGIKTQVYLDSCGRHFLKYMRGDQDERHDRAVVWNILGAMWTLEHKPEVDNDEK